MEGIKRLLSNLEELGYQSLILFNKEGICHTQGGVVSNLPVEAWMNLRKNQAVDGFSMPARISFHGPYGLLWVREDFDEQYAMHVQMVDMTVEIERMQKLQLFYRDMFHEMGRVSDAGILVVDKRGQLLYENDAAAQIELRTSIEEVLAADEAPSAMYDELIAEYPSHKIYRRGLPEQRGILIFAKSQQERRQAEESFGTTASLERKIIGQTPSMEEIMNTINKVAPTDSTVLIRGESGTGKEGFAKLIHDKSLRKDEPFIAINCASIPEHLLESELFGYAKGSFTGALKGGKIGKFEAANKGTLFLDEIGDMSWNLQAKILRVLEEKVIEKVGGTHPIKVDVRIISATHQNLEDMIMKKQFRKDLFYRLNVIPVHIPALRERADDIENLVHYYMKKHCIVNNRPFMVPSAATMERLQAYQWPGNIRELINVVEYIVSTEEGEIVTEQMLPHEILNVKIRDSLESKVYQSVEQTVKRQVKPVDQPMVTKKKKSAKPRKPNREELLQLLDEFGYSSENKKELAKHLGISPATLYRWLKKHEIT